MRINIGLCFEKPSIHKYLYVYNASEEFNEKFDIQLRDGI